MKISKFLILMFLLNLISFFLFGCLQINPNILVSVDKDTLEFRGETQKTIYLTITPINGFKGKVEISLVDTSLFSLNNSTSTTVDISSEKKVPLTIKLADNVQPNDYDLKLKIVTGTIIKYINLKVSVRDNDVNPAQETAKPTFNITSDIDKLTVEQGGSQSFNITITPENNFTGTVNFVLENADGSQASSDISISPTKIDVPDNQQVTFTMVLSISSYATPGTYNLRIKAYDSSNTIEKFVYITLNTGGFDIKLEPENTDFEIAIGSSTETHLVITPNSGFTGTINLELQNATSGQTSNVITMIPSQILIEDTKPVSLLISINVSSTANPGIYYLRISATSGDIRRYIYINVKVQ
ncbi:MAG: hypothetical protein PWP02_436 [Thermosipho sp. (in: thermotogales)]|nr:hypothetical protein [Geotoga sp.]MDN5324726.1 hypothetical protein [Thermosipho sp. (in: thermotogales)]